MAELDIAERRVPQDGRIRLRMLQQEDRPARLDPPTIYGEKIVLRILDKSNLTLDLDEARVRAARRSRSLSARDRAAVRHDPGDRADRIAARRRPSTRR